ncbi:MAG: hypothetical protein PF569_03425 [Candidatus Woesearchaeota archaeon]|jgi:predicted S18 family serine protease|nr:hypothetical protein [Candidatus Woesearchaeota archaeon]
MIKKKKSLKFSITIILIKILIVGFFVFGFYYTNNSFENDISLLAVTEDSNGNAVGGSIINLNLRIKPGNGQIYTNLNTIEEVDTQISIINSQKIACDLFALDCNEYDFFYNFEGSALVLKGPSASSAIAILTAKTVKKQPIIDEVVITGALNSGGIIGNVGGVDEKISIAQELGFRKVLIPVFSSYDENVTYFIEIVKVIDVIEAYNNFNNQTHYDLKTQTINNSNYKRVMENLGQKMCDRSLNLINDIDFGIIKDNSSEDSSKEIADNSYNSSKTAKINENYYSQGSFCFNANLNYKALLETQKNLTLDDRNTELNALKSKVNLKYVEISSDGYLSKIKTINDFYVYLLLIDRIEESREFLKIAEDIEENNLISTNSNINISDLAEIDILTKEEINSQKTRLYSYASERFYTVELWEELIINNGDRVKFNDKTISDACVKINREISIKSQLLNNYGFGFLNEEIGEQIGLGEPFSNKYLCIYKGLELNGKINTLLNSMGINDEDQKNYTKELLEITNSRLNHNTNGDFPLIPYIYFEYSKDLFEQDDLSSSMLYSNYALSYTDLNIYLEKEVTRKSYFNTIIVELFSGNNESLVFLGALLVLLAFLK